MLSYLSFKPPLHDPLFKVTVGTRPATACDVFESIATAFGGEDDLRVVVGME